MTAKKHDGNISLPANPMLMFVASMATVLGAKLFLIADLGSLTPFWDQWDAEAAALYKPYLEGTLRLWDLVLPHNEHRIVWTRLLSLILLELNGRWDPVLQMAINAVLHVVALAILLHLLGSVLSVRAQAALAVVLAIVFSLPFGWENTLAGFDSPFYFLILFSFLCFRFGFDATALSPKWWISLSLAVAAYFSQASGALTLLALLSLWGLQVVLGIRRDWRDYLGLALGAIVVGLMLHDVPNLAQHEALKAHSLSQFLAVWSRLAGWPLPLPGVGMFILYTPAAIVIWTVLKRCPKASDRIWLHVVLAAWMALQIGSIAYARGSASGASRYLDIVAIGVVFNSASLFWLVRDGVRLPVRIASAWTVLVIAALIVLATYKLPSQLSGRSQHASQQTTNLKAFLATGDYANLADKARLDIPYPSAERLRTLASDPTIRSILPIELMPAQEAASVDARLVLGGLTAPVLALVKWLLLSFGPALLGLGVALFCMPKFQRRGSMNPMEVR